MNKNDTEVTMIEIPNCDICRERGITTKAAVDGKTLAGPWAYMCRKHHLAYGVGLGLGKGQRLFLKIEENVNGR